MCTDKLEVRWTQTDIGQGCPPALKKPQPAPVISVCWLDEKTKLLIYESGAWEWKCWRKNDAGSQQRRREGRRTWDAHASSSASTRVDGYDCKSVEGLAAVLHCRILLFPFRASTLRMVPAGPSDCSPEIDSVPIQSSKFENPFRRRPRTVWCISAID